MNKSILSGELKAPTALLRWTVLIFVSIVIATNYYVYDAMSAIKSVMQTELNLSSEQYGYIVSFYSFPNTFLLMSIFGGIILDKFGIRKVGFIFVLLCVLGAFVTAYASSDVFSSGGLGYSSLNSFWKSLSPEFKLLCLGRLLFGLGAETSIVVINKIMVKWFKGKELAVAFAINIAIARLGTAAALNLSPTFVNTPGGWTNALWLAAVLMGIGLLFFVVYMLYDVSYDKKYGKINLLAEDEQFKMKDIYDLIANKSFIYICLLCVTFYSAVFPFQAYCPDLLHNKFGVSLEMSGTLTSLIVTGTIFFTPFFGFFVEKKGKRASLMFLGSLLLIVSHLFLSLTNLTPYVSMFVLGIAFSLVPAAMWPSVALIVEEKKLGTAYGLMASIQNLGLYAFPILAGMILDKTNPGVTTQALNAGTATLDYTWTVLMFAGLGVVGFVFAYLLKRADRVTGNNVLEDSTMDTPSTV